jgi:hypothetical protein
MITLGGLSSPVRDAEPGPAKVEGIPLPATLA